MTDLLSSWMNDRPTEATVLAFLVFSSTSGFIYLFIYFINFGGWGLLLFGSK